MTDIKDIALEYYSRVDAGDVNWIVDMFTANGTYDRAGQIIQGHSALRVFYAEGRKIKINHGDLKLWQDGSDIFVEGSFQGVGADGSDRVGQFADHWTFNDAGQVTLRRTSLFSGSGYIKE